MRLRNWLLAAALAASGSCLADNPRNCALSSNACAQGERCNMVTQRCEPLDCTVNTTLCASNEYCDGLSKRCVLKNCVRDPALCIETQDCNMTTQMCETRSFVLGQPDAMTNLQAAYGMNNPQGVLLVPDTGGKTKVIVADTGNNRVLIWNDLPDSNQPADVVLGLPDVHTLNGGSPYGGVNERSLSSPCSMTSDGKMLVVADQVAHRVLIWNPIPTQPSGAEPIPANQVWGQPDFEANTTNAGSDTTNGLGVNQPGAFLFRSSAGVNGPFFVPDRLNNRVLAFDAGVPAVPQTNPTRIYGQAFADTNVPDTTQTALREPRSVASDGTRIFVADSKNHRIMVFNQAPAGNNPMAVGVFGQSLVSLYTTGAGNNGGLNQYSLFNPTSVAIPTTAASAKRLFVTDSGNNRVLRFSFTPATVPNGADQVYGQDLMNTNGANRLGAPTASTLSNPTSVHSDDTHLAVADSGNNRVLLWKSIPATMNGVAADVVLGQPSFASNIANTPPTGDPIPFYVPLAVETDGTRLAIADSANHRVLIWNSIPRNGSTLPDVVVGQDNLSGKLCNAGNTLPSEKTLCRPESVSFDGQRMIIADTGNNRVLLYDQIPTTNNASATYLVGKAMFNVQPFRPAGQFGTNQPTDAVMANGVLYVADFFHHRVLIYTNNPWSMDPTPTYALGQPNTMFATANYGGQSASTLNTPRSVRVYGNKLLVADRANHRVLIWNTLPMSNGKAADVVVGQTGFGSSYTRTDRAQLNLPRSVMVHQDRLYVSAQVQNRILYWNEIPTKNGQRADGVLGQTDYLSSYPNHPDLEPLAKLAGPVGMAAFRDQLFIADSINNRVVVRAVP